MESHIKNLLEKINSLHDSITSSLPTRKNWDKEFMEKVKMDFTYTSNKLEGNSLTYGETISFLKQATIPSKSNKDLLDIENHKKVIDRLFDQYNRPISVESIKETHKELMKDHSQWDFDTLPNPGRFKIFENYAILPSGKVKEYMAPENVEEAMKNLVDAINTDLTNTNIDSLDKHPLTIAAKFHNIFSNEIHPFTDGNGRVGRIYTNMVLLKTDFPPIFIETKDDVARLEYINAILDCDKRGNLYPIMDYLGVRLIESQQRKLEAVKSIRREPSKNIANKILSQNNLNPKKNKGLSM